MYMRLDDFRTSQQPKSFPILITVSVFVLLLSAVVLAYELVQYSEQSAEISATFGNDVVIGGIQVGGQQEPDRLALLEMVYIEQPIELRYDGAPIRLMPSEIGFRLDIDAMEAAATNQSGEAPWRGFWKHLWRQDEQSIDIPLSANYDPAELRRYLEDLSLRYDRLGGDVQFNSSNNSYTFEGTSASTRLDINAAIPLIDRALFEIDPARRRVDLPLLTTPGREPAMADLRQAILNYFENDGRIFYDGPNMAASVFVIDLETGEEMGINQQVLHDATSIIKIGILINYFRHAITEPTGDVKALLAAAVICSDNGAANNLMYLTSQDGSYIDGLRRVDQTFCEAGAVHTQITSNLDIGTIEQAGLPTNYYTIIQPLPCDGRSIPSAALDQSIVTNASSQNQTTAADIGTLLMNVYDCATHGSGLRTIFPDEITQTECNWILEIMRGTNFMHLMELGVPSTVDLAHKVGYAGDTFGDAGIVFSPGGDYIFVMYVWQQGGVDGTGALTDIRKWDMIGDVNRIVYNYFNPTQPMLETQAPPLGIRGAACVLPNRGYEINLYDIDENRFDEYGNPIPGVACYDYPECRAFDNWGRN